MFAGNAGTITVAGQIDFNSLDFRTGGYVLVADAGGTLNTTTADTLVRAGSGVTTIGVPITGSGGLHVRGDGRIILTGNNTYRGGTEINGGTLSVSSDRNLGAASGRLRFDDGTLELTADIVSGRATSLGTGGGTIRSAGGTTSILSGDFDGSGSLRKSGEGSLVRLAPARTPAGQSSKTARSRSVTAARPEASQVMYATTACSSSAGRTSRPSEVRSPGAALSSRPAQAR